MLAYRVFPYLPEAKPGMPGHPQYLHKPQGRGRLDNPGHYDLWYLALSPAGAVAEEFGNLRRWSQDVFEVPFLPDSRRYLATFSIPDGLNLLDLDNPQNLVDLNIRPTEVVGRNRAASQSWALRVFQQRNSAGDGSWAGVKWWSFHRPHGEVVGIWQVPGESVPMSLQAVDDLGLSNVHVQDALESLGKVTV